MFIISKRNFKIHLPCGETYRIQKDFIGDIPDEVAAHPLIQNAINGGLIACPEAHRDKDLYRADEDAALKALAGDIRPDAPKVDKVTEEGAEARKKASRRLKKA